MKKEKIEKVNYCLYARFSTAKAASEGVPPDDYNVSADKNKEIAIGGEMINGKVSSSYSGNEKDALK